MQIVPQLRLIELGSTAPYALKARLTRESSFRTPLHRPKLGGKENVMIPIAVAHGFSGDGTG
jgi:hypothetical protein